MNFFYKNKSYSSGYTLVELLVVIAIVGILSSVVFFTVSSARDKSRMSTAKMHEANHVGALRNSLVAEWKFDECSGNTANDSSGSDAHLTLIGNPIWSTDTPTKTGCALDFNGTTQYAYATDNPALDLDNNFTLSAWVFIKDNNNKIMIAKSNGTLNGAYLGYGFGGFGYVFGAHNIANSPFSPIEGYFSNNWNYVTGVIKDGKRILYVNGNKISEYISSGNSWNNNLNFTIASDAGGSYKSNIRIDNVRIYSSYLTASEIQKLYAEESSQRKLAEAKY